MVFTFDLLIQTVTKLVNIFSYTNNLFTKMSG